jgi:cellulose synthase/poly-beta-1,6-N-acetylglucosamine synthase-like glycosyltransferase
MFDTVTLLECAVWVCFGLVCYTYLGYPVVIRALAALVGRRGGAPEPRAEEWPSVSLLIAAHNEAGIIEERIRNALALDYPAGKLEVVVATDGCHDATAEIVRRYADRGVRLLEYPLRRGKATVLNDSIPQLTGAVVVLSDANTFTEPGAVRRLARWFTDGRVGVVCGRLVLTDPVTGTNADGMYWRYETFLKRCEGRLGALLGANGGIYAVRRSCFSPIPPDTLIDDFVLPLQAKLRTGCSIVYDPDAVAHEETPPNIRCEFRRRARIGAGGFQSVGRVWGLLNPARGWVALTFVSHKLLRWTCPFFLLALLLACALLWDDPVYRTLLFAQLAFYTTSALVPFVPTNARLLKPLRLTTMFTGMNVALLLGFWRWVSGGQRGTWQRTARTGEA